MKDFVWQYVDIPEEEIIWLQELYLKNLHQVNKNGRFFFQLIDIGITHFLGINLFQSVLIQAPPNLSGIGDKQIHFDVPMIENSTLALNIPLTNCEKSSTLFWESSSLPNVVATTQSHLPDYHWFPATSCVKIDEAKLIKPMLFDITKLHSPKNESDEWRLSISLRFVENPWHLVKYRT